MLAIVMNKHVGSSPDEDSEKEGIGYHSVRQWGHLQKLPFDIQESETTSSPRETALASDSDNHLSPLVTRNTTHLNTSSQLPEGRGL